MEKEKIERINFLARKSRTEGLTDSEKNEQKNLRDEYRADLRKSCMAQLDWFYIAEPDGTVKKLISKE